MSRGTKWILLGSAAVLGTAGVLWVVAPGWRKAIVAAVLVSPIPPVP